MSGEEFSTDQMLQEAQSREMQMQNPGELFRVDVLLETKGAQHAHGLRKDENYERYRKWCSKKLHRLRKSLKFLHGRNRFQPKLLELKHITDAKFLFLPLFKAERAWAYAMQLKNQMDTNSRVHFHKMRKISKASKYAKEFKDFCDVKADEKTRIEAEAYFCWMHGQLLLEKGEWEESMVNFLSAKIIYNGFSTVGSSHFRELCNQKVEEMEHSSLRYCIYNLKNEGQELIDESNSKFNELKARVQKVISELETTQEGVEMQISWNGQKVPVPNEKLQNLFQSPILQEKYEQHPPQEQISVLEKIIKLYGNAHRLVQSEMKNISNKSFSEEQKENLQILKRYINSQKLQNLTKKDLLLLDFYQDDQTRTHSDFVKLLESLIHNMNKLLDLETSSEERKKITTNTLTFKALRCLYLGLTYSKTSKFKEALALFDRALEYSEDALSQASLCPKGSTEVSRLENFENKVEVHKGEVNAQKFLQRVREKQEQTETVAPKKELQLIAFPPEFELLKCKPIIFDLALESCQYPNIESRTKPSSIWNRFFG